MMRGDRSRSQYNSQRTPSSAEARQSQQKSCLLSTGEDMNTHGIKIAAACALAFAYATPGTAAPVAIDVSAYERTVERDEAEGALDYAAIYTCEYGDRTKAIAHPAIGCAIAYEKALAAKRYDDALRHAVMGCEKYGNAPACRAAPRVPLYMGNASVPVPVRYAAELKRLAQVVCFSGQRITHEYAGDSTGRECSNLARHFLLARDIEYRHALQPAARAYFEAAYDARFAADLARASCTRWGERAGCEQARIASRRMEETQALRASGSPSAAAAAAGPVRVSAPAPAR